MMNEDNFLSQPNPSQETTLNPGIPIPFDNWVNPSFPKIPSNVNEYDHLMPFETNGNNPSLCWNAKDSYSNSVNNCSQDFSREPNMGVTANAFNSDLCTSKSDHVAITRNFDLENQLSVSSNIDSFGNTLIYNPTMNLNPVLPYNSTDNAPFKSVLSTSSGTIQSNLEIPGNNVKNGPDCALTNSKTFPNDDIHQVSQYECVEEREKEIVSNETCERLEYKNYEETHSSETCHRLSMSNEEQIIGDNSNSSKNQVTHVNVDCENNDSLQKEVLSPEKPLDNEINSIQVIENFTRQDNETTTDGLIVGSTDFTNETGFINKSLESSTGPMYSNEDKSLTYIEPETIEEENMSVVELNKSSRILCEEKSENCTKAVTYSKDMTETSENKVTDIAEIVMNLQDSEKVREYSVQKKLTNMNLNLESCESDKVKMDTFEFAAINSEPLNVDKGGSEPMNDDKVYSEPLNIYKGGSEPKNDDKVYSEPLNIDKGGSEPMNDDKVYSEPLNIDKISSEIMNDDKIDSEQLIYDGKCSEVSKDDESLKPLNKSLSADETNEDIDTAPKKNKHNSHPFKERFESIDSNPLNDKSLKPLNKSLTINNDSNIINMSITPKEASVKEKIKCDNIPNGFENEDSLNCFGNDKSTIENEGDSPHDIIIKDTFTINEEQMKELENCSVDEEDLIEHPTGEVMLPLDNIEGATGVKRRTSDLGYPIAEEYFPPPKTSKKNKNVSATKKYKKQKRLSFSPNKRKRKKSIEAVNWDETKLIAGTPSSQQKQFLGLPFFLEELSAINPSLVVVRERFNLEGVKMKVTCVTLHETVLDWALSETLLGPFDSGKTIRPKLNLKWRYNLQFPEGRVKRKEDLHPVSLGPIFPFSMPSFKREDIPEEEMAKEEEVKLPYPLEQLSLLCPSSVGWRKISGQKDSESASGSSSSLNMQAVSFAEEPLEWAFKETFLSSFEDSPILSDLLGLNSSTKKWPDVTEEILALEGVDGTFPFTCPSSKRTYETILFSDLSPQLPPSLLHETFQIPPMPSDLDKRLTGERDSLVKLLAVASFYKHVSCIPTVRTNRKLSVSQAALVASFRPLIISQANTFALVIKEARERLLQGTTCQDPSVITALIRGPIQCKRNCLFSNVHKLESAVNKDPNNKLQYI